MKAVYVISSPLGYQKIGWSRDPVQRIKQLNNGHPEQLFLHLSLEHVLAAEIALRTYNHLQECRASGEWFKCCPNTAASAVEYALSEAENKVSWKRAWAYKPVEKRKKYTKKPYTPEKAKWSDDRADMLRILCTMKMPIEDMQRELSKLPGKPMTLSATMRRIRYMNIVI